MAQNSTTVDSASFLQQPTREYSNGAKDVRAGSYVWALEREKVVLRRGVVVR